MFAFPGLCNGNITLLQARNFKLGTQSRVCTIDPCWQRMLDNYQRKTVSFPVRKSGCIGGGVTGTKLNINMDHSNERSGNWRNWCTFARAGSKAQRWRRWEHMNIDRVRRKKKKGTVILGTTLCHRHEQKPRVNTEGLKEQPMVHYRHIRACSNKRTYAADYVRNLCLIMPLIHLQKRWTETIKKQPGIDWISPPDFHLMATFHTTACQQERWKSFALALFFFFPRGLSSPLPPEVAWHTFMN